MSAHISSDRILLIVIDIILAAAIVMLILRFIKLRMMRKIEEDQPKIVKWMSMFNELLDKNGRREAVTHTFKKVVEDLGELLDMDLPESLTAMEALIKVCTKLSEPARRKLIQLYRIYEPARFGGRNPSNDDVKSFRDNLAELEKVYDLMRGTG